ncbi:unnamed protein product [Prorocentrum cordatum]|uniref:Subtilisin n=1 Tax=Prorocentrum cordatum TaxID=2364126 RepID=A0ABN9PF27_9DINO|nr:unnamed protein product [Polarella glacialis]
MRFAWGWRDVNTVEHGGATSIKLCEMLEYGAANSENDSHAHYAHWNAAHRTGTGAVADIGKASKNPCRNECICIGPAMPAAPRLLRCSSELAYVRVEALTRPCRRSDGRDNKESMLSGVTGACQCPPPCLEAQTWHRSDVCIFPSARTIEEHP